MTADETLDRAAAAALALAQDRPWDDITLRDIAAKAGVPFAELYARADAKAAVVDWLSRRFDAAAIKAGEADAADVHDRLFDATMARIEAMEPHRFVLIAIGKAEPTHAHARRLPRTARAILEAAGVDTGGWAGAARLAAMSAVLARLLQVWRDDEGALNRTMAEADKRLKEMRSGLKRLGAGF
jgi:AcrR family transcriptional regulator